VTLTNCDSNLYNHILYKPLQDWDYRPKEKPSQNRLFYLRIKVSIVYIFYSVYFKFYYALLDLKKIVIFAYFRLFKFVR